MKARLPERVALAGALALAALLRLGWPGLTEFKPDEAHLYALALDLAEFKAFPLRGISSSVGLPNSPMSVYLYALPLFIWKSPLAATLFVGALNTASVALAYAMTRRYWGPRAALVSVLLYAAAPWAVIYSRKIWAQNLLPLFVVGYIFSGLLAFIESRWKWLTVHLILLAILIQIHFSGIALAPITAVLLIVFRKRLDRRSLMAGTVGALITAVPFVFFVMRQGIRMSGGDLTTGLLVFPLFVIAVILGTHITPDALQMSALVIQGIQIHSLAGSEAYRAFLASVPNFTPLLWAGGGLVALSAVYVVNAWVTVRRAGQRLSLMNKAEMIVVLWLILPILFFTPHTFPVFPHYFILLFPAPYLLSGIGLNAVLARWRTRWQRIALWLLPLVIVGGQAWLSLALLRFVGTQNTPGAFGTPLGRLIESAEAAKRLGSEDVLILSHGADPNIDTIPAVFDALLRGVPHRFIDGGTTAVFPAGSATVILWPGDYTSVDLYRLWGGGQWSDTVSLRAGEGEVRFAVGSGVTLAIPRPRAASALLNNGAELLGSGGDATRWELWWLAPGPVEGENYHVFAHVLDANGERIAQADQATYVSHAWRSNDLVVNYFVLAGPVLERGGVPDLIRPGQGVTVRAGMYAYPSLAPAVVLDAAGDPAGEWIEFPLPKP